MRRPLYLCTASLLGGCILSNPGFDESASSGASDAGTETGVSSGASAGPTSEGSASSGVSDASTSEPTSAGSQSGTSTGSTSASTGEGTTEATTTGGGTTGASTGESEGSTSTGDPLSCAKDQAVDIVLKPTENTYVVTSAGDLCPWTDSNLKLVNPAFPCEELNFGSAAVKYTLIGQEGAARGEYLVRFGVHQAMLDHPWMGIAKAELAIVPWWSMNRKDVTISVGVVDYDDAWLQGDKPALPAEDGDSNWTSRMIDGVGQPWSSGDGPSAGSLDAASIGLAELIGGEHPLVTSSPIDPALLQPWVDDAADEQGFVLYTSIDPILVKNKDTQYAPILRLQLCPL